VARTIKRSAWFILVVLTADLCAETPDELDLATAHYAAFLFASVATQLDEELSEKGMSDAEEQVLWENVSSRVARCHLDSLRVYGDASFDAAIQWLSAGGDPAGLTPLLREAVKAAGDWNAIIGAMSHEQEICIAAMNQEFGINYY
jgi:hypothetical protein